MSSFNFNGKADVLLYLKENVTLSHIPPLTVIQHSDWLGNSRKISKSISQEFSSSIAVRSSTSTEDSTSSSMAGHFTTKLNIPSNDINSIEKSVNEVFNSYENHNQHSRAFIQEFITPVKLSGVLFTHEINSGAPYYIINYDDQSGLTDTVTSGTNAQLKKVVIYRNSPHIPHEFINLINAIKEIEVLTQCQKLDIEFAITNENEIVIFQVRPLVCLKGKDDTMSSRLEGTLEKMYKKIEKLNLPHPELFGDRTFFGVMPDWNPAEIIGFRPRKLAISLYKELITDRIWAYQRHNYGYKNLRSFPLLISFISVPYIDVRVDFNSFIPEALDKNIGNKLVNYYLKKFENNPELHDKIEFDIVFSCNVPGLNKKLKRLTEDNFSNEDISAIESALTNITNDITREDGLFNKDLKKIDILDDRFNSVVNSNMPIINKIYWLVEDCKRYGTLPFAGIARSAFVAMQFLNSFVDNDLITQEQKNIFLTSVETTNKKFQKDLYLVKTNQLSKDTLIKRYGHLRQGTYDISMETYQSNFKRYFNVEQATLINEIEFSLDNQTKKRIDQQLTQCGINSNCDQIFNFIQHATEQREHSKLIFTRHISKILELIFELVQRYGLDREEASYLDIGTLLNLYTTLDHQDLEDILKNDISKNKILYQMTKNIQLPSVIIKPKDCYCFTALNSEANFITLNKIAAPIQTHITNKSQLAGHIVFIESADPGYDWIFSHNIAGLITQFGGANSHMAIRCAELGIPAIIGSGDKLYAKWSQANVINLDCSLKVVSILE